MHCRAGRPLPYQAPALQHGGMRGDMREGIEIMRGHEHGERVLPHKLFDQGQYLPLSLPVQRGRRFVQEQQLRLLNEGPGESSPLQLPPGELPQGTMGQINRAPPLSDVDRVSSLSRSPGLLKSPNRP